MAQPVMPPRPHSRQKVVEGLVASSRYDLPVMRCINELLYFSQCLHRHSCCGTHTCCRQKWSNVKACWVVELVVIMRAILLYLHIEVYKQTLMFCRNDPITSICSIIVYYPLSILSPVSSDIHMYDSKIIY